MVVEAAVAVPQDKAELAPAAAAGRQPGKEHNAGAPRAASRPAPRGCRWWSIQPVLRTDLGTPGCLPKVIQDNAKFRHFGPNSFQTPIGLGHAIAMVTSFTKALVVPNELPMYKFIVDNAGATTNMASVTGIPQARPERPRNSLPVQINCNRHGAFTGSGSAKVT